jgi:colanic acid biosynthesis glycosyl transferase WcaI
MHIVALNHVYWPNSAATAQLLTELLEGLALRGHEVTVVARDERDAEGRWLGSAERAGVRIERVRDTGLGKGKLWRRAADYASFYAGAALALARSKQRPDVLMALTTPPLIAVPAQLVGRLRGVPVVSVVQDLYPDVAVALGAIPPNGIVHKTFAAATKASLGASAAIVVLSDAMRQRVLAYGPRPERIVTIPNWALSELEAAPQGREFGQEARLAYGLGDRFVVMYSGNMGAGHTFETLLKAAQRLQDRSDIVFAFVGDGVRRGEVERFISNHRLDNTRLLPLAPRAFLAESLGAADLHVVTMRDDMAGLIVPSKLYGIYAAERPVLFIGPRDADVAASVAASQAGSAFANGDVDGVVAFITAQAALADRGREAGRRGYAFLQREHGRASAIDAYERVLVAAREGRPATLTPGHTANPSALHGGRA